MKHLIGICLAITALLTFTYECSTAQNSGNGLLSENTKAYAREVSKKLADEGMVLLENQKRDAATGKLTGEKALPLAEGTKVSVFGSAQLGWNTTTFYDGLGSEFVDLMTALRNNPKIQINEELAKLYVDAESPGTMAAGPDVQSGAAEGRRGGGPPGGNAGSFRRANNVEMPLDDATLNKAAAFSDVAIIVIKRSGSEGSEGAATAGSYYLSAEEEQMVDEVNAKFDRVIVVFNIPKVMDAQWIKDKHIDAAILAWYPGYHGAESLSQILTGNINPSGRLADTFAKKWEHYPSSAHWADSDGSDAEGNPHVYYTDDIYVGYRYFETFNVPVCYAFGYGLSYTDFELSGFNVSMNSNGKVVAKVNVNNTGTTAGKQVVQIYYALSDAAWDAGTDSPAKQLAAYGKTDLLKPGQTQAMTITYDFKSMAAYSEVEAAFMLYAGAYKTMIGTSVKDIKYTTSLPCTATVATGVLSHQMVPREEIKVLDGTKYDNKSMDSGIKRRYDPGFTSTNIGVLGQATPIDRTEYNSNKKGYKLTDVAKGAVSLDAFIDDLSLEELVTLTSGLPDVGFFGVPQIDGKSYGDHNHTLPTGDVEKYQVTGRTAGITERDIVQLTMADRQETVGYYTEGGFNTTNPIGDQGFQVYPSNTLNACTWNLDLATEYGMAMGAECKEGGLDVFLAPSMNIHRNPLGGRNSEYFSEDPVLSGTMAGAQGIGFQTRGIGVTFKHFACNNQETNRRQVDEIISERALREIYLKGYEIAVKTVKPWALMTSYNKVNGAFTPENFSMLEKIARDEWGFDGLVMTDWGSSAPVNNILVAGNDLIMGSNRNLNELFNAVMDGTVPLKFIKQDVKNILNVVLRSDQFYSRTGLSKPSSLNYKPGAPHFKVSLQ